MVLMINAGIKGQLDNSVPRDVSAEKAEFKYLYFCG